MNDGPNERIEGSKKTLPMIKNFLKYKTLFYGCKLSLSTDHWGLYIDDANFLEFHNSILEKIHPALYPNTNSLKIGGSCATILKGWRVGAEPRPLCLTRLLYSFAVYR